MTTQLMSTWSGSTEKNKFQHERINKITSDINFWFVEWRKECQSREILTLHILRPGENSIYSKFRIIIITHKENVFIFLKKKPRWEEMAQKYVSHLYFIYSYRKLHLDYPPGDTIRLLAFTNNLKCNFEY